MRLDPVEPFFGMPLWTADSIIVKPAVMDIRVCILRRFGVTSISVGVRYFNFADGLYVVRALTEHGQLIGGRVMELDDQPIDSVL